jgi:hypothetical protein
MPPSVHLLPLNDPERDGRQLALADADTDPVAAGVRELHEVALRLPAPRSAGTEAEVTPLSSQPSALTRTAADAADRGSNYDLLSA